jgi:hypothetical protein
MIFSLVDSEDCFKIRTFTVIAVIQKLTKNNFKKKTLQISIFISKKN